LQNVIERSVILSQGPELRIAMPEFNSQLAPVVLVGRASNGLEDAERARILQALKEAKGRSGGPTAPPQLGLKRTTLQSRMKKYKIGSFGESVQMLAS
jgi:transcriptional regulator of acetoin/glycerol metabolism